MDVDQLLAEVDGVLDEATGSGSSAIQKFSQPQPEPKTKTTKISTPITVATPERKKTGSEKPAMSPTTALGEIDELLNEIDSVDALHVTGNDKKKFSTSGSESSLSKKTKCNKVYLGPGNSSRTDGRKLCTRMRCTSCDFEVLRFDNSKWNDKVSYLFFRNNTPNVARLSVNLLSTQGNAAYCCQCSWISLEKVSSLDDSSIFSKFRWTCAGRC
mmetsp:Transcript_17270/g.27576  ORF Transcript_17270/g.27576 Transcript_17270/m.27576 type:complete len:214 (-) Transcript_17270:56-697(-)